jgi:hypothetical protein
VKLPSTNRHLAFAAPLCLLAGGCGNDAEMAKEGQLPPALAAEIEKVCDLPEGALSGQASISEEAMPKMACAVEEARKRGVTFGFISNPVDPDAQTH